ncbi:MAG: hypothetical protein PHH26_01555 [Candidatus Thermoplasmatota archaeon]|nr:hypothetical protein [Candidatus Thermoplasmatota archaeon]
MLREFIKILKNSRYLLIGITMLACAIALSIAAMVRLPYGNSQISLPVLAIPAAILSFAGMGLCAFGLMEIFQGGLRN